MARRYWDPAASQQPIALLGYPRGRRGALQPAADIYPPVTQTIHWSNMNMLSAPFLGVGGGYKSRIEAVAKQSVRAAN